MKWSTNTEYITYQKAAKRLYLSKIPKNYGASKKDLTCAVVCCKVDP